MATTKMRTSPFGRAFSVYVAFVLLMAVAGPGMVVFATEGEVPADQVVMPVESPEVAAEEAAPEIEAPVEEPAVVAEAPAEEPLPPADEPIAAVEPSVETESATVKAATVSVPTALVDPVQLPESPSYLCAGGMKIDLPDDPTGGTYEPGMGDVETTPTTPDDAEVTISVTHTDLGPVFSFTSNYPVSRVVVKGGEVDPNHYIYDPAVMSDSGLHAPMNASSGKYYGLSHIKFCFGEIEEPEYGSIVVHKYEDLNRNGRDDAGEPMLQGWEFTVYDGDTVVARGTTDAEGTVTFSNVPVGHYRVVETLLSGWVSTTGVERSAAVVAGDTTYLCFGNAREIEEPEYGSIMVHKYLDSGLDIPVDEMEPLEGWGFTVYDGDTVVASGSTNAAGMVLFEGLEPGDYEVVESLLSGWVSTTGRSQYATVVADETTHLWFGNAREIIDPEPGAILVHKFEDLNENGEYDEGEPMLEGWEFTLTMAPMLENGLVAQIVLELDSGTTDEDGMLLFDGLMPGEYTVTETPQDGWFNTTPLAQTVTVSEDTTEHLWFGNAREIIDPEPGAILVHKFEDLNENGEYDEGEPMLEGWEFTLTMAPMLENGIVPQIVLELDSGTTDEDGMLLFDGLMPGEYTVTETPQDGWFNTTPLAQTVTVSEETTEPLWFGNAREFVEPEPGAILVHKFEDLNENGEYDEGEPMLEGWEFTLTMEPMLEDTMVPLNGVPSVLGVTDEDGMLLFDDLMPGVAYTVTETLQDGWTNTTPLAQTVTVGENQTAHLWFGNIEEFLPFTELDLAITKSVDKATAEPGDLLTYTLKYWNNGETVATNFTIVDDYDERYVTVVDAAGGTVSGGKITWNLAGPLAKEDGFKTVTYTMRVVGDMPEGTTNVDNVVVISHPDDSDPTNNTDDARVRVGEPFLPFTGSEALILLFGAVLASVAGLGMRIRASRLLA